MSFRTLALAVPVVLLVAGTAACGDDGGSTGTTGGAGGSDSSCGVAVTPVANSEYCQNGAALNCNVVSAATPNQMCSVAVKDAPAELARATDTDEFAGEGLPNVSCYAPATYPPPPPASTAVDLTGHVRIFSNGCESKDVTIEVYNVAPDGQLAGLIGSAVVTPSSCAESGETTEDENCDRGRIECTYTYPGVPTETNLAVKTSGASWQSLIAYNVYIPTDDVVDGAYEYDPRALATDDYGVIAQASIGRPIAPSNGAIAGEVHDCDDVRLINAVANTNVLQQGFTYFTSDEDNPLPETGAQGTSRLGLYAALDVVPGPATVAAAGMVNGQMVSLGEHKVYVYANTVSSLTFRGMRPYQVPAATP